MTKFHGYKMEVNDSVAQHIAKVENLARQLKDVGEDLSDVMIMAKILGTLPSKFNPLITAWDSVNEADRTKDYLTQRLITEENRLANLEEASNALNAVKIHKKGGGTHANKSPKETSGTKAAKRNKWDITCHYCHKKGHVENRCYKKRDDVRDKKEANSSTKENNSENFGAFVTSKCEPVSHILTSDPNKVWILDSGASKHMCFRREWFANLNENYREFVSLGDNSICEAKGRGTINIKMYVEGRWLDGRIDDVLFIPSLRRNLFSTGVCTSKGYVLKFDRDNVNIYRGDSVLACGVRQSNNLFRLLIKVNEVNEVNAATVNSLKTWHERLRHINCLSLHKMIKENIVNGISLTDSNKFFCENYQFGKQHRLLNLEEKTIVTEK